ncbi:MAG: c-type cytochrome domain-containing protein [Anaerolineales bacterium]
MKSLYAKIALTVLIAGLLSACGTQPAGIPVSGATETALPATQVPTDLPTDTAAPTEPAAATEAPATQPAAAGATVSFATDILPIFESRCINCHGGDRTQEGLDLKTHAALMAGSNNGSVVTPGDAANSLLVELVVTQKMPKRGPKLTPPQIELITEWVNQGALDN